MSEQGPRPTDDEVARLLADLPKPQIPDFVNAAILRELRNAEPEPPVAEPEAEQRRPLGALLLAAAVAAVLMLVGVTVHDTGGNTPVAAAAPTLVKSGAVYDPTDLIAQVRRRMSEQAGGEPAVQNTFAASPTGVQACLRTLQAAEPALLIDAGTYQARPAVVVVTRYVLNNSFLEVWVVDPSCGNPDAGWTAAGLREKALMPMVATE